VLAQGERGFEVYSFSSSDYDKGYIQDIKYDGYPIVTLEQLLASPFYLE